MKKKSMLALTLTALMALSACTGSKPPAESKSEEPSKEAAASTAEKTPEPEVKENEGLVAEDGAVVKFAYWEGSQSDKDAWNVILEGFKKDHPEIKLEAEPYPSQTYVAQLDTMVAGNNWPDVMRYTYQKIGKFKEAEVMLDITDMVEKETYDDFLPAFKEAFLDKGKVLGVAHHTDTVAIFYNKEMFAKSGVRIPTSPADAWTWDELTEIAKKLKTENNLENAFAGIWENKNGYRFLPFVYMNGGSLLSEDGTKITVDTPEFKSAIKLYEDWRKDDLVARIGFTQEAQANNMFIAKQLAFVFAGSWHCSFMQENLPDGWAVTYMPQVNGKTSSDLGGNGLFAYAGTKYPKASAIFMNYVARKENMKTFCETGNFIPVLDSLSKEELSYAKFPSEMQVFKTITSTVDPKMAKDETSNRFQALNLIFSEEMDPLVIAGASTDDVVKKMAEKMQEALDE